MELKDTIGFMQSNDYKERFKAEYYQLLIRYNSLIKMLYKWDNNDLDFKPTCNRGLYDFQIKAMEDYIIVLETRAKIENIEL